MTFRAPRWACVPRVLGILALGASFVLAPAARSQPVVPAGSGSYYGSTPSGLEVPQDSAGAAVSPRVSASFTGAPPTNKWWSSLIWPRYPGNGYGEPMYPHPLSIQARATGLTVGLPTLPTITATDYYFDSTGRATGLVVGVEGLSAATMRVASAGDWHVVAEFTSPGRTLRTTFGRGMPYVYAEVSGGNARVDFTPSGTSTASVWSNSGNVVGVTINGAPYGLFAPAGATWTITGNRATSTLAGKSYYSVAALPEATPAALNLFAQRAFVFITDTRASWAYNAAASTVDATFTFTTTVKEGTATSPLVALYRHQWLNSTQAFTSYTYPSSRGLMKLADASAFTVNFPFRGLINKFPLVGNVASTNNLYALVDAEYQAASLAGPADTYFAGRNYGRICQLVHLADVVGHTAAKARFLDFLKTDLREWFTAGPIGGGRSAFEPIEAESFNDSNNVTIAPIPTGVGVTNIQDGSWLKYSGVNFGSTRPTRLLLQYASSTSGSGLLEVHLDSLTGPVIAGGGVGSTGGQWREIALGLTSPGIDSVSGIRDIYITVTTPYAGELFRLDSFRFDRAGAVSDRFYAYNQTWRTLIGYPTSFGSGAELNDHHFHHGYFIYAAATVAQYDPAWASQYGPMVELLVRDSANDVRTDTTFPVLRNFDPHAGHAMASGHAGFFAGNNQESSSESMNFNAGVALWGAATGNDRLRDLGLFLFASEAAAIQQYWFDADNAVYPAAANRRIAGIVWDSGIAYGTFFSAAPEHIHGINFLPITPTTLYLGWRPDGTLKSYNQMLAVKGGPPTLWQSVHWSALATVDPTQAANLLTANPTYSPDSPDSKAQMVQFIRTLAEVGTIDASVRADTPFYAVFSRAGARTYWAWNPTSQARLVTFTTGVSVCVPPGQTISTTTGTSGGCCIADFDNNSTVEVADIFAYLTAWFAQLPTADLDGGGVNVSDIFFFLGRWFAGC